MQESAFLSFSVNAGKRVLQREAHLTLWLMAISVPWRDKTKLATVLATYFCRQIWREIAKCRQTWRPFGDIFGPSLCNIYMAPL